ncbi:phosphoribosylanthranilate isomerase [Fundidesulfovibrio putealis]|uniref:phosphoribosylanthranilate isomerase n=1 Tax=Fundidesulfovibrio putealis TaxID=270496 RepID=UPI0004279009|nr:phosphoribosylanthranilate isomerase [Fundidesulfovibrio putealis]
MNLLLKVCGMTLPEQVEAINAMGVDLLGFIFAKNSPRCVTPEHVAGIARGNAKRVGVFVEQDADEVNRIMETAKLDYAQLHAGQDADFCRAVGPQRVIRVFWPQRHDSLEALEQEMARYADLCAFMLLDSGTSGGGHGTSLDFVALARLNAPRPWLLAGGLSPDNAALAVEQARPDGLDVNSGVESAPGVKNIETVERVIRNIKRY